MKSVVLEELPGKGVGFVPLTPIAAKILGTAGSIDTFYQAVSVSVPVGLDLSRLAATLQVVVDQHDALRARLLPDHSGFDIAPGCAVDTWVRRTVTEALPGTPEFEEALTQATADAASRLDPYRGDTAQIVWLDSTHDSGRLVGRHPPSGCRRRLVADSPSGLRCSLATDRSRWHAGTDARRNVHCGVGRTDSPSCHRRRNSSTGVRSSTSMVRRSVRVLSMRNGTEGRHCVESGSTSTVTQQITCCARYRRTIGPVSTTACSVRLPWHCAPGADHSGCWSRSKVTDETKTCCPVPTCPGPSGWFHGGVPGFGSISPDSEWTRRRS